MVNIDIAKIKEISSEYKNIIDGTNNNNLDIIYWFDMLFDFWIDDNSTKLSEDFNLEKNRYFVLHENMKKHKSVYDFLIENYSTFGNKIVCDETNSPYVLYKMDIIIDRLKYLIFLYEDLGNISSYSESSLIIDHRDQLKTILDKFIKLKSSIDNEYKYINDIEKNVSEMLEKIKLEKLLLNNYESEK